MPEESEVESQVATLLADPVYFGHPLRDALDLLFTHYQDHVTQLERLTSISDGYHSAIHQQNQSLSERCRKQIRQLEKIVRISDRYQEMLRDANQQLEAVSMQDPLTGLPNRRLILERLTTQTAITTRRQTPFSIALIDIDHFKSINDRFGHEAGDHSLVAIARTLNGALRPSDVCARWGGEEFMILLPETSGRHALPIAERLRLMIHAVSVPDLPDSLQFSASIGVAEHPPGAEFSDTIHLADTAMYAAKRGGRNRVVLAEPAS